MGESEAVFVGATADVFDEKLSVYRTPNGSAVVKGSRGSALGLDPGQVTELRELLDRVAMPGQVTQ